MIKHGKLEEIASVKLGMAFKKAVVDLGDIGKVKLIQSGDLNPDGTIRIDELSQVNPEQDASRHFLQSGDILLRLRGPAFTAAILNYDVAKPLIATNQMAIIRPKSAGVEPYFIYWYLNSDEGKRYFAANSEGSNMSKLNAKVVAQMSIPLPSLAEQQKISEIQQNWTLQKGLYKELIVSGDEYFDSVCGEILSGKFKTKL